MEQKQPYMFEKLKSVDDEFEKKHKINYTNSAQKKKYVKFYIKNNENYVRYGVCQLYSKPNYKYSADMILYSKNVHNITLKNIDLIFENTLKNIHHPKIFFYSNIEKKYIMFKFDYIYENSEIEDIYFYIINAEYVILYKNGIIYKKIKRVLPWHTIGTLFPNKIIYYKLKSNCKHKDLLEKNYIATMYDVQNDSEISLGFYSHEDINCHTYGPTTAIYMQSLGKSKKDLYDDFNVYFYFSFCNSKPFYILFDFIQNADKIQIIQKEFDDDISINYKVTYKRSRIDEINFVFNTMLYGNIKRVSIYGYTIQEIISSLVYECKLDYEEQLITNEKFQRLRKIVDLLKEKYNVSTDFELLKKMVDKYGASVIWNDWVNDNYLYPFVSQFSKEKYNDIYNHIIENGQFIPRWKSETEMFRLIKNYYPDAIYQYHADWLGKQSLDVFVPSIKVAFEYQGKQHYFPVDIFGGLEHFKYNKIRDNLKKDKLKNQAIDLIEWKYDEKIDLLNLKDKLKKCNIDIKIANVDNINQNHNNHNIWNFNNYELITKASHQLNNSLYNPREERFVLSLQFKNELYIDNVHKCFILDDEKNHINDNYFLNNIINLYRFNELNNFYMISYVDETDKYKILYQHHKSFNKIQLENLNLKKNSLLCILEIECDKHQFTYRQINMECLKCEEINFLKTILISFIDVGNIENIIESNKLVDGDTKLSCDEIKELEQDLEKNKQEENPRIDIFTYTIDDSQVFDAIDDKLSNIDLKNLYKIKEKLESSNDDTELIDKAIVNRKKKDLIEKENLKRLRKHERKENHLSLGQILCGLFLGLPKNKKSTNTKKIEHLMPWEQEEVNKGNYETWNFEEEELEDDDYYNDDLD